ncbi:MAG: amino acid ABC transporter permease [Thaumarchaeota archaeon]|nr:amino acid ABC transporter permease [Nitrososphaerota archaeon]
MSFWGDFLTRLSAGTLTTLELLSITIPLSIILGILIGVLRVYGGRLGSALANFYVFIFRGFPLLVTMMIMFFGLADVGIMLEPFWAASAAIILCSSAYQSEYVKTAILSIGKGQSLAARALGMNRFQEIAYVIMPQALRTALPGITNEILYMILYSSLAYVIGVSEIFASAMTMNSIWVRPGEIFGTIALVYLSMTTTASTVFKEIENRLRIPGFEGAR